MKQHMLLITIHFWCYKNTHTILIINLNHQHITSIMVKYICAAQHLCKAIDLPIPMKMIAADGQGPYHPCAGCGKGAHSSGFGCTELLVDAYSQLDLTHLPTHVPSKTDARYQVICLLCIGKYYKNNRRNKQFHIWLHQLLLLLCWKMV